MPAKEASQQSFEEIFAALKPIFEKYADSLAVQVDKPDQYYLETRTAVRKGQRFQFGGVKIGKAYVSFHLMTVMRPAIQAAISPELKKRMQGKSCFNFTRVEPSHIAELTKLAAAGFEEFKTWPAKFGSA
jgi:hypothetical protein